MMCGFLDKWTVRNIEGEVAPGQPVSQQMGRFNLAKADEMAASRLARNLWSPNSIRCLFMCLLISQTVRKSDTRRGFMVCSDLPCTVPFQQLDWSMNSNGFTTKLYASGVRLTNLVIYDRYDVTQDHRKPRSPWIKIILNKDHHTPWTMILWDFKPATSDPSLLSDSISVINPWLSVP